MCHFISVKHWCTARHDSSWTFNNNNKAAEQKQASHGREWVQSDGEETAGEQEQVQFPEKPEVINLPLRWNEAVAALLVATQWSYVEPLYYSHPFIFIYSAYF